jgi:UDP-3-O-[3-hydroxymyristoyl] glucosamine N-acyltransferase
VVISGGANVTNSIRQPGVYGGAIPSDEARRWRKNAVRFGQLDDLARRLQQLESAVRKQRNGDT